MLDKADDLLDEIYDSLYKESNRDSAYFETFPIANYLSNCIGWLHKGKIVHATLDLELTKMRYRETKDIIVQQHIKSIEQIFVLIEAYIVYLKLEKSI